MYWHRNQLVEGCRLRQHRQEILDGTQDFSLNVLLGDYIFPCNHRTDFIHRSGYKYFYDVNNQE